MDYRSNTQRFPGVTAIALFVAALFSSGCGTISLDGTGLGTCDIFNCDSLFFRYAANAEDHNEEDVDAADAADHDDEVEDEDAGSNDDGDADNVEDHSEDEDDLHEDDE